MFEWSSQGKEDRRTLLTGLGILMQRDKHITQSTKMLYTPYMIYEQCRMYNGL